MRLRHVAQALAGAGLVGSMTVGTAAPSEALCSGQGSRYRYLSPGESFTLSPGDGDVRTDGDGAMYLRARASGAYPGGGDWGYLTLTDHRWVTDELVATVFYRANFNSSAGYWSSPGPRETNLAYVRNDWSSSKGMTLDYRCK